MGRILVVVAMALALLPAGALAADPPPGAVISDSLKYVKRVPNSEFMVEGKLDSVDGRHVLITTGRFGFRSYDISDPADPVLLDTFQPPEILGENGYGRTKTCKWTRAAGSSSARSIRVTTT